MSENPQQKGTRINISAVAETALANDEVIITFRVEKEGKDADKVRNFVNRVTAAIQAQLKNERGVKHKTISRNMLPVWHYPKNQERVRSAWKMTQLEQVSSTELENVANWLDIIEKTGAQLNHLHFRLSKQLTKETEAQLRIKAIESFKQEATLISKGIQAKTFKIIQLNTSSHNPQPQRMEMSMMSHSKAQAAAPNLSSGEGSLRVTVNGQIEVPFHEFQVK